MAILGPVPVIHEAWAKEFKAINDSKATVFFIFIVFSELNVFVLVQEKKDDAQKASCKKYAYEPKKSLYISWSLGNVNAQLNNIQVNALKKIFEIFSTVVVFIFLFHELKSLFI